MAKVPSLLARIGFASVVTTFALGVVPAHATVVFDTTLASPNGNPVDAVQHSTNNTSWFNGSGNPQGGFTVSTANGIELGLRAKVRGSPSVFDSPNDVYTFSDGTAGGRAIWNYEFSIDVNPGGAGSLTLADITAVTLTVTDLGTSAVSVINPLAAFGDDSGYGSTPGNTNMAKHSPPVAADWVAQNSENLSFAFQPLAGDFNPNNADDYTFALAVTIGGNTTTDSIQVDAVPEPASLILLCTGLLGFGVARRRKRRLG